MSTRVSVRYKRGLYYCTDARLARESAFGHRDGAWVTARHQVAARLREYMDAEAREINDRVMLTISPWTGPLPQPPGLKLKDFQENMALFALARNRSYLAADPGVGKTPVAAVIAAALRLPTVYICPPFLTLNVQKELETWWPTCNVEIHDPKHPLEALAFAPQVLIVADSILGRHDTEHAIKTLLRHNGKPGLLIVDEAHRYKTLGRVRTSSLFGDELPGIGHYFTRHVYLSGTPMPNRPMELFPVLDACAPQCIHFMDYDRYGRKYCGPRWNGFGWEFKRASNLKELKAHVVGTFMMRVRKKDVLTELPPKTEEAVLIGDRPPKAVKLESAILAKHSPEDLMAGRVSSEHMSSYRKELGLLKVSASAEFVKNILQDTDESVLLFAYHRDVVAGLAEKLKKYKPIVILGGVKKTDRHEWVTEFQKETGPRLFIGNYLAAGIGLTLTKASRVVFAEFSWVPEADNDQASDRAHRFGQTRPVHVQYLVYRDSIDRTVIEVGLRKRLVTQSL